MPDRHELEKSLFTILEAKHYSAEDIAFIRKALHLAVVSHQAQLRASGEEYVIHPISVALYLAEMNVDREMIATGLLHDVVEDTNVSEEEIAREFGESVALLVDGVTKISKLKATSSTERKAETIRKMLFAMIKDMRVIVIKLADKVHNMSTLEFLPIEKQRRIAQETLEIYAPLAGKLGLGVIKNELENMALKTLHPTTYEQIVRFSQERESEKADIITQVSRKLNQNLGKNNIQYVIKSRVKHYYSVYKKMKEFNKKVEDIFDLYGIRIVTDTIEDCYAVFGIVHSLFKPLPERFKDYIANPKSNGYRSLHTTVMVGKRKALEIQIRTADMDKMNEYGIAAHWLYKTGKKAESSELKWIESLKKVQQDELSPEDYYQAIRNDILSEEIYVFSPKGDIYEMPKGATALDFAYRVHTEVGHRCKGARADGQIVPLHAPLKNGVVVEVLTGKDFSPKREWISLVKTNEAKKKIRHFFTSKEREKREALEAVKRVQPKVSPTPIAPKKQDFILREVNEKAQRIGERVHIEMDGMTNLLFNFAKCCEPHPPEPIVGFVSRGRGLIIHRADCKNLEHIAGFEERSVQVDWGMTKKVAQVCSFFMKTAPTNRSYIDISNCAKKFGGKILNYRIDEASLSDERVDGYFTLEFPEKTNHDSVMKELDGLDSIYFIEKR